jgi:hypothetical protein
MPAFRFTSAGAGNSFLTQDKSGLTAGTTYTASFLADFGPSTLGSGARYVVTLPSNTQFAYTATALASGLWLWSVTFTIPSGDNYLFGLIGNVDGGAGTTWRVAQPQLEVGAWRSSPMPTVDATTTRAQDFPLGVLGTWASQTGGLLVVDYVRTHTVPAATYPGVAELWGGDGDRVLVAAQPAAIADVNVQMRRGGTTVASLGMSGASGLNRVAIAWSAVGCDAAQNGGAVQADTSVALPAVRLTQLRIGYVDSALDGYIRRLRYRAYGSKVPGATVVALSSDSTPTVGDRFTLTGTPTEAGTTYPTIQLRDSSGAAAVSRQFTQRVIDPDADALPRRTWIGPDGGGASWRKRA